GLFRLGELPGEAPGRGAFCEWVTAIAGCFLQFAVEVAGDARGADEDAEGVPGAGHEASDGSRFGSFEDVGKLGDPFILVDGDPLGGGESAGSEAEDGVGQVVQPVAYFFAGHVA